MDLRPGRAPRERRCQHAAALVNIGSLAGSQTSMDVRTAPILAAAANQQGTNSALTLVAQPSATAANSSWHLTDVASS